MVALIANGIVVVKSVRRKTADAVTTAADHSSKSLPNRSATMTDRDIARRAYELCVTRGREYGQHRADQARQSVCRLSSHERDGPQRRQKSAASGVWETLSDRRRSRIAKNTAKVRCSQKKKPAA